MTHETVERIALAIRSRAEGDSGRWLRRAELQLEFARAFAAGLPGDRTAGWAEQIERAERGLEAFDPETGPEGLADAVRAMEAELTDLGRAAKEYTIHCVGHGHLDMNWMWSWPETVASAHDTFASALRLMRQYPDFTYSQSQAAVYALVERYHPAMFEEIRRRVQEGRWEVTAAHWVEGDKNLASGESLCRHLLYTREYFREKFGLSPEDLPVDWEPDTFGHAATIPSIIAQGAVRYYYSCRQGGGFDHARTGDARPAMFWWRGPDGARVLVNYETTWYNSDVNIGPNIALPLIAFAQETGLRDWLNVYGVGNHGGGPTRAEIDHYRELQTWPIYPRIVFSTTKAFFEAAERDSGDSLPVIDSELNYEFTGCYTSQSLIKQANRFGENFLEEAETLALLAARLRGRPYPDALLREAGTNVLFNQFHDILPGSGVRETREHAMALFQEVGAITGSIKREATQALFGRIDTLALLPDTPAGREERALALTGETDAAFEAGAGLEAGLTGLSESRGGGRRFRPFVVYNPSAWPRSERVTAALYDTGFDPARIVALDEAGVAHPTLCVGAGHEWPAWSHLRIVVSFDAQDVPALGYRTYLLCEGQADTPDGTVWARPQERFETPFLSLRVDRFGSGLLELTDRRTGANLIPAGSSLGAWAAVTEQPRGMTAWTLGHEGTLLALQSSSFQVLGTILNLGTGLPTEGSRAAYRLTQTLIVPGTTSTVRLSLTIHALEPRLDFEAEVDWREIGDSERGIPGLVVRFPLALSDVQSRYEVPFGSVERSLTRGEEVPTLRYAHIAGTARTAGGEPKTVGVTLLQDCKYGHSLHVGDDGTCELRLRIVRSSFDPDPTPEVARHTVRYSLFLHDGPADPASLARLGAAWNHPFLVLPTDLRAGDEPARRGFAHVPTPGVVLTALKQAASGNGLILRLVELNGEDTEAVVELDPALTAGLSGATLLDLMERPLPGPVRFEGATVRVPIPAHSFVTVGLFGEEEPKRCP